MFSGFAVRSALVAFPAFGLASGFATVGTACLAGTGLGRIHRPGSDGSSL
jgi:hypothetical protein